MSAASLPEAEEFRRPVSPTEWWFVCHPDEMASVIEIVVEGTGRIDPAALAAAVGVASEACPGARLVRHDRTWVDSGRTPPVHVVDGRDTDVLLLPALHTPLTGQDGPTCDVVLVAGSLTSVVFRAAHAVMDARGIVTWATEVFRALRGEPVLPAADAVGEDDVLAGIATPEAQDDPGPTFPSLLGQPTAAAAQGPRTLWRRRTLPGNHPGLVAKLACAMTGAAGAASCRFAVAVDLRRHRPDVRSTANLSQSIPVDVSGDQRWEQVHERLLRALADRHDLRDRVHPSLLEMPVQELRALIQDLDGSSARRDAYRADATLSHVGRLATAELHAPGFTAHTAYHLSTLSIGGPPELNVVEVDGRTELTLAWRNGSGTAERADALLDAVEEALAPVAARRWAGNDTGREVPTDVSVVELFLEQAARTPDAVALSGPDGDLTYAGLAHRSAVVAADLLARGVGRETVVGVLADRSAAAIVAVWGVLRAGAAYLPLDAHHPDARVADLLTDAGAPVCLVQASQRSRTCVPEGCAAVVIESLDHAGDTPVVDVQARPDDLAYVIYTSGSTGRPKGVEVEHRSLANYAWWAAREFGIDADTRLPLIVSLSFDVAGTTIFLPLLVGGTIVLMAEDVNHASLRSLLTGSGANALSLTPSHLDLIGRLDVTPTGFRTVVVVGEQLRRSVAQRAARMFGEGCAIVNLYGPTEATIGCTVHRFDEATDTDPSVPIGVPMDNNTVFLLDAHRRFVKPGELGEMYLGGAQLARGYRGRPDLDSERFVLLADGTRAYRTGDIARVLPSGELGFVGRTDDQVKVLGHRIEPVEIAQALETHPAVGAAVVVPVTRPGQDHTSLCAYAVTTAEVTVAELDDHVAARLPRYMVPSVTVFVADIPQTVNGKVDVRALPDPFADPGTTAAPTDRDDVATAVAAVWARVLGVPVERVDGRADFHQLGGNSLLLLSMLAAVSTEVVGSAGERRFMAELGRIIREPTLDLVAELARASRLPENDFAVIPTRRGCPFDPPAGYARLRETEPVSRVSFAVKPGEHDGWLVTRLADVKAVLADQRFSRRNELLAQVIVPSFPIDTYDPPAAEPGAFNKMDAPGHTRYRTLLARHFTMRRMRDMQPLVAKVAGKCLDEMALATTPVDLVAAYAAPLPSRVMCELVGLPEADRTEVLRHFAVIFCLTYTVEALTESIVAVSALFERLVRATMAAPGDDLLGVLAADGTLDEQELVNILWVLIGGAFDTTTNMLALGTFALLRHPDQLDALRGDPGLVDNAVEELLRYLTISHLGCSRAALADVELGGRTIRAGETAVLGLAAANRDPRRFEQPDRLDLRRSAQGHVAFGYGAHQCIGQNHARVVLRTGYLALFERFPTLRLAVDADEVVTNEHVQHYGVAALPVTWDR